MADYSADSGWQRKRSYQWKDTVGPVEERATNANFSPVLDYTGGTLAVPMTVLVEEYWREIGDGLAGYGIPVPHFVLHADQDTLRARIAGDTVVGPNSSFRLRYLEPYAEAARTWLHAEAEVVDTTHLTPDLAALRIAETVKG
ncbi:hypothetical protein STENM223S_04844 [Streptomyces tendae]